MRAGARTALDTVARLAGAGGLLLEAHAALGRAVTRAPALAALYGGRDATAAAAAGEGAGVQVGHGPALAAGDRARALGIAHAAAVAVGRANRLRRRGATCLQRALALVELLERRGVDGRIRIGARRSDGGEALEAHAWVEVCELPVDAPPSVTAAYAVFDEALVPRAPGA